MNNKKMVKIAPKPCLCNIYLELKSEYYFVSNNNKNKKNSLFINKLSEIEREGEKSFYE